MFPNSKSYFPAVIILGILAIHVFSAVFEVHPPSTDVFLFREAGINLATRGTFTVANLPHMSTDIPTIFAYYPPLYPFLYGLWCKVAGISLTRTLLFDALIQILKALSLLVLLRRFSLKKVSGLTTIVIFIFSLFTIDRDRPEELCLLLGITSLIPNRWFLAGPLLGLCGATSPTGGIFFALLHILRCRYDVKYLVKVGALAAFTFGGCLLPIYLSDPLAFSRFSKQVPLSAFPYLGMGSVAGGFREWVADLEPWVKMGYPYVILFFGLFGFCFYFGRRLFPREGFISRHFLVVNLIFWILNVMVWTLQPYYLWFPCMALLLAAAWIVEQTPEPRLKFQRAALLVALLIPLAMREGKLFANRMEMAAVESPEQIRQRVTKIIGNKRLAITPDQYFTFRPYREVENIRYVCGRLDHYDYIYATRYMSARRDAEAAFFFQCWEKRDCFETEENLSTNKIFTFLGKESPYFVKGNGGLLLRNTHCRNDSPRLPPRISSLK